MSDPDAYRVIDRERSGFWMTPGPGSLAVGLRVGRFMMNSASEKRVDLEDKTKLTGDSAGPDNSPLNSEHLIIICQKRQLVKVFRPQEKSITLGRSSRCSLVLPDPRFPREAGEIVLGPVPILRKFTTGQDKAEFIHFHPGKPYRFRPYTLTLLGPGDVFFNKPGKKKKVRQWLLKPLFLIGGTLVIAILLSLNYFFLKKAGSAKGKTSLATVIEQKKVDIVPASEMPEEVLKEDIRPEASVISGSDVKRDVDPVKVSPTPTSFQKAVVSNHARQSATKSSTPLSIESVELETIIKKADEFIEQGDLKTAGRTLAPLLPHINNEQRALIIYHLDPLVKVLFQKAYMLKPYEPELSNEILMSIVESGLEILPSCRKAKKVLFKERSK